jgi:hypothetical protein
MHVSSSTVVQILTDHPNITTEQIQRHLQERGIFAPIEKLRLVIAKLVKEHVIELGQPSGWKLNVVQIDASMCIENHLQTLTGWRSKQVSQIVSDYQAELARMQKECKHQWKAWPLDSNVKICILCEARAPIVHAELTR